MNIPQIAYMHIMHYKRFNMNAHPINNKLYSII